MVRPYLTLWSQPQVEIERRALRGDDTLTHTANNQFRARGVTRGDRIYVVATKAGRLLLLGRLTVDRVVDQREAERILGNDNLYRANDHLLGRGTPLRLDRVVPERIARELERESSKRLAIAPDAYVVNAQSLRATGRITDRSAVLLDFVLDGDVTVATDAPGGMEGGRREQRHAAIERSSKVRTLALAVHGSTCQLCGFSFAAAYGALGEGFAEVHHLKPLASLRRATRVDPATDLAVLCANCHRMVHRRDPPLTPDELGEIIRQHS